MIGPKKQIGKVAIASMIAAVFIFTSFFSLTMNVSADSFTLESGGYSYSAEVTISKFDRLLYENRIIDNGWYNGPTDVMTQAPNGDYLGFVREGIAHVGDNGSLKLYRSTDDAITWTLNATLRNITDKDTRNYACGVTDHGRIFVFYSTYDATNDSWPSPIEYMYSDNNATTWSANTSLTIPTLSGLVPVGASAWGMLRILGDGRVGVTYYAWNATNATQNRFAYSDNNGATWSHIVIGATVANFGRTETDFIYLGNSRIVALARMEAIAGPEMFRSTDNGLTWTADGALPQGLTAGTGAYMSLITDDVGASWVFSFFNQGATTHYMIANGDDLMNHGVSAWPSLVDAPIISSGFPFTLIDQGTGIGIVMGEIEASSSEEFVLIWNLTAELTKSRYPTSISPMITVIAIMFAIGIVVGVIAEGTKSLRKEKLPTTQEMVKSVLNMVIYIVIGMALIGVVYSALG